MQQFWLYSVQMRIPPLKNWIDRHSYLHMLYTSMFPHVAIHTSTCVVGPGVAMVALNHVFGGIWLSTGAAVVLLLAFGVFGWRSVYSAE